MKINVKTMKIRKIIIIGFQKYVLMKQNCVMFIMTTYARFLRYSTFNYFISFE